MNKITRNPSSSEPVAGAVPMADVSVKRQTVLVLQGGGALGAYQAGVYQALVEGGIEPDWVIGTSIGAINAALIAGNEPKDRLPRLREFWDRRQPEQPARRVLPDDGSEQHLCQYGHGDARHTGLLRTEPKRHVRGQSRSRASRMPPTTPPIRSRGRWTT